MQKKEQLLKAVLKCKDIKTLDRKTFLNAWRTVFFLSPGLTPDEWENPEGGWPEQLKPLAAEAVRRFENGEFSEEVFYPYRSAMKGIKARCRAK